MADFNDGTADIVDESAAMDEDEFMALQDEYLTYGTYTPEGDE